MKEKEIEDLSFIMSSRRRYIILDAMRREGILTPTMLSKKVDYDKSVVSKILKELQSKNFIKYLNPGAKKGRLIQITDYGDKIINIIDCR